MNKGKMKPYNPALPHCVSYETGNGAPQEVVRFLVNIARTERAKQNVSLDEAHPRWLLEIPTLNEILTTSWHYQMRQYEGESTALSLAGHASTQQLWQHFQWIEHGRRVYEIGETLAAGLVDTEMRVALRDIPVPIPAYYLRVPETLGLTVWNKETGEHVLDGFYVRHSFLENLEGEKNAVSILAIGRPQDTGFGVTDDALAAFSIPGNVDNVEEWLETDESRLPARRGLGTNDHRTKAWSRLVLGACLYLATGDADTEKRRLGPSEEARKKAKGMSGKAGKRYLDSLTLPVHYVRVGFKETLDPQLLERAQASKEARELTKRFVVRGHYRNQAHGPGRQERKVIYIKPHWKGPTWAEAVSARIHRVE